ncbi:hypothetical protein BS50DRAFT_575535 [Corynespora cassiicola Philippines]|uniref:Uncharacterized protein n=1 Tax=Corynespora cassiicola Philippines TaxID=1448308 RepID=A0A2T2NJZ0_CORCC|nr:hypothetical protein BS50DRAFT_575535 [Corynespora cassiicola Philippines]
MRRLSKARRTQSSLLISTSFPESVRASKKANRQAPQALQRIADRAPTADHATLASITDVNGRAQRRSTGWLRSRS